MRLIFVPLWLSQAMQQQGLPESALLDQSALSPFFSKKDLNCYNRLALNARDYLEMAFGIELSSSAEALVSVDRPLPDLAISTTDHIVNEFERSNDERGVAHEMVGRHLPTGYQWSLKAQPLPGPKGGDVIGLFAHVFEGTSEDKVHADTAFLAELLDLLYAHNLTIDKLAWTGFLGAYVNRLG